MPQSLAGEGPGAAPGDRAGGGPGIHFSWAMGAATGTNRQFSAITKDTALKSGDEIKMMVRLEAACFVYVLHQDSKGEYALLFPYDLAQFQAGELKVGTNYYIPKGPPWFQLDDKKGLERVYVLAAEQRLEPLEQLWGNYRKATGDARSRLGEQLTQQVRELRRSSRSSETPVDRPARVGGNVRGNEGDGKPDVASLATSITGTRLLTRAITIDHK